MELGLLEKMKIIFELLFSSFMSIEILIFFLLLFLLLIFNIKIKNKIVPIALSVVCISLMLSFMIGFSSYTITCVDSFIMKVMDYYYFPSTVVFFFICLFMIGVFIYTLFSKKLNTLKKVINYLCSIVVFLFFSLFTCIAIVNKLDLADQIALYENKQIITVVQVSNLVVLFWIIVTVFYYLYLFFKKKFDKEKVEN